MAEMANFSQEYLKMLLIHTPLHDSPLLPSSDLTPEEVQNTYQ